MPGGAVVDDVGAMAVDTNGDVYVLDRGTDEVVVEPQGSIPEARLVTRIPPFGGGLREELFGIAVDGANVYFSSDVRSHDGSQCAYAIRAVPKEGGVARVIARGEARGGLATDVLVDDASLFFLRQVNEDLDAGGIRLVGEVIRVPKAGGATETVATGLGGFFAFALDGDFLDYARPDRDGGPLMRVGKRLGTPQALVTTTGAVMGIAVGASHVYYTERQVDKGRIALARIPAAGGKPEPLGDYAGFGALVFDGGRVFWSEDGDDKDHSRVMALAESGGEPHRVFGELPRGRYWTVRGGKVYWSIGTGVVSRPLE